MRGVFIGQQGTWNTVLFRLSAATVALDSDKLAQTDMEADTQTSVAKLHRFDVCMSSFTHKVNIETCVAHCTARCMQ